MNMSSSTNDAVQLSEISHVTNVHTVDYCSASLGPMSNSVNARSLGQDILIKRELALAQTYREPAEQEFPVTQR